MREKIRIHFPSALCHLISQGDRSQRIYKDDEDRRRFQTLLGEVVKCHSIKLYAYLLMRNQFYLLLEVTRALLANTLRACSTVIPATTKSKDFDGLLDTSSNNRLWNRVAPFRGGTKL